MSDLVKRLRQMDRGWPTILSTAADRIEQLERELAASAKDYDVAKAFYDLAVGERNRAWSTIEELRRELAAEKALADRLYEAGRNHRVSSFHARDKSFIDAHRAYRKARGL